MQADLKQKKNRPQFRQVLKNARVAGVACGDESQGAAAYKGSSNQLADDGWLLEAFCNLCANLCCDEDYRQLKKKRFRDDGLSSKGFAGGFFQHRGHVLRRSASLDRVGGSEDVATVAPEDLDTLAYLALHVFNRAER